MVSGAENLRDMQGHSPNEQSPGFVATALPYLAYLILWVLLSALVGLLGWSIRTNIFNLGIWLWWNPWLVRGVDLWFIFAFGILWVIYIFGVEGYLRTAIGQKRLWTKASRALISLLMLLAISYGLQFSANILLFLRNR